MAGKGDILAGRAYVELLLKNGAFTKGLNNSGKMLKSFGAGVATFGGIIAGFGAAIVGPATAAAKAWAENGAAMFDMSKRTGIAVERLSELKFAADENGTSIEAVDKASGKMQKAIGGAADGSKELADGLAKMHLSADALKKLSPDEQFAAIGKALNAMPTGDRQVAAMQVFGKSGRELLPMLENLDEAKKRANELGLVMSGESAKSAKELSVALSEAGKVSKGIWTAIGAAVAPVLTDMTKRTMMIAMAARNWLREHKPLIATAFRLGVVLGIVGTAIAAVGAGIVLAGSVLTGLATVLGTVGTVLGVVLSPIGLIAAALAAGAFLWFKYSESAKSMVAFVKPVLGDLLTTVKETIGGIVDALSTGDIALAGKIAMAGLKVAFLTGIAFIAETVGGAMGDFIGTLGKQIASGDLAGVWNTVVSGMLSVWTGFSSGIVQVFTKAADAIIEKWRSTVTGISNFILEQSAKGGLFGTIASKVLGVDLAEEQKKWERLNAEQAKHGFKPQGGNVLDAAKGNAAAAINKQADAAKAAADGLATAIALADKATKANLAGAIAGGAKGAWDAVKAAQDQLDALNGKAADQAAAAKRKRDEDNKAQGAGLGSIPGRVAVTFSAAAAVALGQGGGNHTKTLVELSRENNIKRAAAEREQTAIFKGVLAEMRAGNTRFE